MTLVGDVDFNTVVTIRDVGMQAMSRPGCHRLTIDMSEVTFLDSQGIGTLVGLNDAARGKDMTLVIVVPSPQVRRVLQLSGLDKVLTIDQDG
jgi:anti-anti-sigma factor